MPCSRRLLSGRTDRSKRSILWCSSTLCASRSDNKAIHIALGVRADGTKEVLGLWIEQNEGAKFWLRVMNELKKRGTEDILLAVVDGLKGFPEAIRAVFPEATVQTCIVHLLRTSLDFVSFKDRKAVATALKDIYRATDDLAAATALDTFEAGPWGLKYLPSCRVGAAHGQKSFRSTRFLPMFAGSSTP
jgi:transposase-like protein